MAKKKINSFVAFLCGFVIFLIGTAGGFFIKTLALDDYEIPATENYSFSSVGALDVKTIKDKELSIHFLELGNKYTGDCTFIKVGETEILIDAGSRADSVKPIYDYIFPLIDGKLDYVVVTHAHQDHYAGFATGENTDSLLDLIKAENIIKFAQTNQKDSSKLYKNFLRELEETKAKNGTNVYSALDCYKNEKGAKRVYELSDNVKMEILYQKYYEEKATTENDYSVCLKINRTSGAETYSYLFTGDLEKDGEESLIQKNNSLGKCVLYKAGHHGSKTYSSAPMLKIIQPDIVCVCACAGSTEYTTNNANTFPTQQFVDNVAPYTDEVYVTTLCLDYKQGTFTSMNGNIVIATTSGSANVEKYFSASSAKLKDTDWFKANRTMPAAWKQPAA